MKLHYGLHARIEVFEDGLRKGRPLWGDEEIRYETVERALLPMTSEGLLLFAGREPTLCRFLIMLAGMDRSGTVPSVKQEAAAHCDPSPP